MSDIVAEIATARARIDSSDMDPVAKMIAHGFINAHIMLFQEVAKNRAAREKDAKR